MAILNTQTNIAVAQVDVAYSASHNFIDSGTLLSYNINATLDCVVAYDNVVDYSTCHINATPTSGLLTVKYHIVSPLNPTLDGTKTIPLSAEQLSGLVNDSQPFNVPIPPPPDPPIGTATIDFHGKLIAENITVTPQGSANPNKIEWLNWKQQNTIISSTSSKVTLKLDTEYENSANVTVSILGIPVAIKEPTPLTQFAGKPSISFTISLKASPTPTPTVTQTPTSSPTLTSMPTESPSIVPTPSPSIPEFPSVIVAALLTIAIVTSLALVSSRKRPN
jgi:hypothetical protein